MVILTDQMRKKINYLITWYDTKTDEETIKYLKKNQGKRRHKHNLYLNESKKNNKVIKDFQGKLVVEPIRKKKG